jgi:hypothetical protein
MMAQALSTNLEFKRLQEAAFVEYVSWFADAELNHALGPMDVAEWPQWPFGKPVVPLE